MATERPVLDGRVLIRCTSATVQRIRERKPLHTRAGVTRAALLIGLEYMEHEERERHGSG